MKPDLRIETDRLILRAYNETDLDDHVEILGDWDVTRWLSTNIPFPYSRPAGEAFINEAKANFQEGDQICFSIIDKITERHMGGLKIFSAKSEECEIGYWLGRGFWAKGFATEFLTAVINWLKQEGTIKKLVAQTANQNVGSRKVLEKVGFRHKGLPPANYARRGHGAGCSEYYVLNIDGRDTG